MFAKVTNLGSSSVRLSECLWMDTWVEIVVGDIKLACLVRQRRRASLFRLSQITHISCFVHLLRGERFRLDSKLLG